MNYNIAKTVKAELENAYTLASATLKAIPGVSSGYAGITPDDVKAREDYKIAKSANDKAFQDLRNFNAMFCNKFKKEYAAERKAKRGW